MAPLTTDVVHLCAATALPLMGAGFNKSGYPGLTYGAMVIPQDFRVSHSRSILCAIVGEIHVALVFSPAIKSVRLMNSIDSNSVFFYICQ